MFMLEIKVDDFQCRWHFYQVTVSSQSIMLSNDINGLLQIQFKVFTGSVLLWTCEYILLCCVCLISSTLPTPFSNMVAAG